MMKRNREVTYPIIICDDNEVLADNLAQEIEVALQNLTDENSNYINIDTSVEYIANTYEQTVGYLVANEIKNGIYFLDIELSKKEEAKNGVDLAEFIKKQDPNSQIIFVTAYDKYAPLTYRRRIGAIDYINKSGTREEIIKRLEETLRNAVDNILNNLKLGAKTLTYKVGRRVQKVNSANIFYIENSTTQHKVKMTTLNGNSEFKGNISELEAKNTFLIKVSQSYLINPENIDAINTQDRLIIFPNQDTVKYARSKKKVIDNILNKYQDISLN